MKPLPTIKQLRHLVAVADTGHFGRAAEASFVTQSTLSASIKEIENILGATLIERTKRSVKFTPLGNDVVARARTVISDVEEIVDLVAAAREPLSGDLRLGVIPTIGPFLVPRAMPKLRKKYPALKLYLREDQTERLLDRLTSGDLDLVLMALPYRTEGFESLPLGDDPFVVACPAGHAFESRRKINPEDLEGEGLLLLEDGHCLRDHALSACKIVSGERRTQGFQATSLQTLVQMVDSGLGVTLLPKLAIDAGILNGTHIVTRPLAGPDASRGIGLVWRRSSSRSPEFHLLADILRQNLTQG